MQVWWGMIGQLTGVLISGYFDPEEAVGIDIYDCDSTNRCECTPYSNR